MIKKIIFSLLRIINKMFFPSFVCPKKLLVPTFKNIFIQKIIGVNRKARWPVHFTSKIIAPKNIRIGNRAPGLSLGCYIDGRNGIVFGNNVWVGPRVSIISKNHSTTNFNKYIEDEPINIGDNTWIAANVVILPGVKLGNHIIIAAGSIVTKSFTEDNILLAGVPAKKIKNIEEYEDE